MWEEYSYSEYMDKLYELRDAVKPAMTRKNEAVGRPQVLSRAKEALVNYGAKLSNESFMELMPANETERMVSKTATFELYVKEKEEAQEALTLTDEPAFMSAEMASKLSKYEDAMEKALAKKPKPKKKPKTKKPDKKPKRDPIELVSYETEAEQMEILTEFYAEIKEDKKQEGIQAILDKRKDEEAEVLSKEQFAELCAKLKVKKFINPLELWAEKHPVADPEEEAEEEGGWFSGWGSDSKDEESEGGDDSGAEEEEGSADDGEEEEDATGDADDAVEEGAADDAEEDEGGEEADDDDEPESESKDDL